MKPETRHFIKLVNHIFLYIFWPRKLGKVQVLASFSLLTLATTVVTSFYVPLYAQKIVNNLVLQPFHTEKEIPWDLVIIFIVLQAFYGIGPLSLVTILQQMLWLPIGHHIQRLVQTAFLEHTHSMSIGWMMDKKLGSVLGALERGTESVVAAIDNILYSLIPTLMRIALAIIYLSLRFGYQYALILGSQIILYILITLFLNEKLSKVQIIVNETEDDLRQKATESMLNFETVKCFTTEQFEQSRYTKKWEALSVQKLRIGGVTSFLELLQQIVVSVGTMACSLLIVSSIVSQQSWGDQRLTVGDYVMCVTFLGQINAPLQYLAKFYNGMRKHIINAEVMLMYLMEQPEIRNIPLAYPIHVQQGAIEFKEVCWANDAGKVILQDVSFTIAPRTTVAVVGETGSGKTSIARLLLRLIEPCSGKVFIDGINTRNVTVDSVRRAIGIIPQDTTLFNDTIRNNIRYGKPKATEHQVRQAASLAQIHERIMRFPDGYNTIVGERGTRLSGGERQRIAIARALVKETKILILDEASSALDADTERKLSVIMRNTVCKNRTCLMITHNLAFTVHTDYIIVLKEGRIVEIGRYLDLVTKKGSHFANMWRKQRRNGGNKTEE